MSVKFAEAVATHLVRFGDKRECLWIAFGDDVLDFVDLTLGRDAGEHFVLFACEIADAMGDCDATVKLGGEFFCNLVRLVGYDVEYDRRLQTCRDLIGDL